MNLCSERVDWHDPVGAVHVPLELDNPVGEDKGPERFVVNDVANASSREPGVVPDFDTVEGPS